MMCVQMSNNWAILWMIPFLKKWRVGARFRRRKPGLRGPGNGTPTSSSRDDHDLGLTHGD